MSRGGSFQPQTLDVDERILDRNLRIVDGGEEGEDFFGQVGKPSTSASISPVLKEPVKPLMPAPDLPSVEVTPEPGICIKTKNLKGNKVFVNLCRVNEIPPAPPMSEARLRTIIAEEDYDCDYRVPMSLGAPREESDKSGQPCLACDVAVNSTWFADTVARSEVFTAFVVHVAMEGLCEKYGDSVNLDRQSWTVLKNKKYLGRPQRHRIQQRAKGNRIEEVAVKPDDQKPKKGKALIQEVSKTADLPLRKTPWEKETPISRPAASLASSRETTPKYKIYKEPKDSETPEKLVTRIDLPGVRSVRELTLDVGEDRVVLEARKVGYLLDIFLPFNVDNNSCSAQFHRDEQVLTVHMLINK